MAELGLLLDLAVVMGAAALAAVVTKPLRLPLLFGFLTAGVLVGPQSPIVPLVRDEASLGTLADLGVVLLLFGLGLTFNFRHLRRVGGVSVVVMVVQGVSMLWLGFELGRWIGWGALDSVFLGAMLSISSTTVAVKVLTELRRDQAEPSRIIFGVLVLQDIAAVAILVVLAAYSATGGLALGDVGLVLAQMLLFLIASMLLGLVLVPRAVDFVAEHHGEEVLVIAVLGLGLGFALLSSLANFHPGLGAFLMGALVSEAKHADLVEARLAPVTHMFVAIFFVAMGTLLDLGLLLVYWKPILAISILVLVGKFVTGAAATFLLGYAPTTIVSVAVGLAQIGEFSFVIAALGRSEGVTSGFLFPIVVGVVAITTLLTPMLVRSDQRILRLLGAVAPDALRTYVSVYTSWMGTVRHRSGPARRAQRVDASRRAGASGVVVLTILGAAWLFQDPGRLFIRGFGLGDPGVTLTYWGLVLAILVPVLFQFYRAVHGWVDTWDLGETTRRRGGVGLHHVVLTSFYLLGAVLFGLPLLAATAPFLRTPVVGLAWVGMVAAGAVLLWAGMTRLHHSIAANVQTLLDDQQLHTRGHQIVRDLTSGDFHWDLRVHSLTIRPRTWAAGKRLGEIDLRGATGASVILVERDGTREEIPGPDTLLLPGDRLTLIGSREQTASAEAALTRPVASEGRRSPVRLGRLLVIEGSPLDGVRLADANLPARVGVQVVALLRHDRSIPNPGREERLHAGDVLLVMGPQDQIAKASALTSPAEAPRDAPPAAPATSE